MSATIPKTKVQAQDISPDNPLVKSTLLAKIISDPDLCSKIGSGWQLFFYLIYVAGGRITGRRDDIGSMFGVSGRTLDNWLTEMTANGIIIRQQRHREIEISLTDEYMPIAQAPDTIIQEKPAEILPDAPRLQMLKKLYDATETSGTKIEVKIVI